VDPKTLPNRTVTKRVPSLTVKGLAVGLGDALGSAHDTGWIDRFVGRHHHHQRRPRLAACVSHVNGADNIGHDPLGDVGLDQGHVFQRRGVEDDVQRRFADESKDPVAVANVAKHSTARKVGPTPGQL
jgi:hypothetical protein